LDADYAYVAADGAGLRIVDISDPFNLIEVGWLGSSSHFVSIAKSNHTAYVADWSGGLKLIDVSSPTDPFSASSYEPPAYTWGGIEATGDYVFVGDDFGIKIVDMVTPEFPILVSWERLTSGSENLALAKGMLFVAGGYSGLFSVDIDNVEDPIVLGNYDTPGFASDLSLKDDYAFVADFDMGVRTVDVSSPTNPIEVSALQLNGSAVAVDITGDILFVACAGDGLSVVDITTPLNLTEVGHYTTTNNVHDVAAGGDYAYLAEGGAGLTILDVSTPSDPSVVSNFSDVGYALSITLIDDYVYVSDNRQLVHVVDVSSPEDPEEMAVRYLPETNTGVSIASGDAYLANGSGGLFVSTGDLGAQGEIVDHNGSPISGVVVEGSFGRVDESGLDGYFKVGGYLPGSYVLTPTMPASAFQPASLSLELPQVEEFPRFIIIAAPVTATLLTTRSTDLGFNDVQGLPTEIHVPAGAVTTTSLLKVTPTLSQDGAHNLFAGHAFELEATAGMVPIDQFLEPVSITISYSDLDIRLIAREDQLWLRWWDGGDYHDAVESCSPSSEYRRDVDTNVISVSVCRRGEYVLMGPTFRLFLPAISVDTE
jgi:hypothetical protein